MNNWQPVETAPKDIQIIVIRKSGRICMARWDEQKYNKQPRPYWRDEGYLGKETMRADWPTHWMPLPEPPNDSPQ